VALESSDGLNTQTKTRNLTTANRSCVSSSA